MNNVKTELTIGLSGTLFRGGRPPRLMGNVRPPASPGNPFTVTPVPVNMEVNGLN